MAKNPPEGYQRIIPYLYYEDSKAAIAFLVKAFGLREHFAMTGKDGAVTHAELGLEDSVVMLGTPVEGDGTPRKVRGLSRHGSVLIYVDDVDAHYERAKAAGAVIKNAPEDKPYGDRMYSAVDPEGHEWFFATHVKDVSPAGY